MDESTRHHLISRRSALRAGAVGMGTLWVTPAVAIVGMDKAEAASDPPKSVRPPNPGRGNPGRGNQEHGNQGRGGRFK